MPTPPFLMRIMSYGMLSRNLDLGPEDRMAVEFATRLRLATIERRLDAIWLHPANELAHGHRTGVKAAIARALGMHRGSPDYLFIWQGGGALLEAKSDIGRLSEGQRDFRDWAISLRVPYHIFRTADEGEEILRGLGVLR